jgi:hypothetical protein
MKSYVRLLFRCAWLSIACVCACGCVTVDQSHSRTGPAHSAIGVQTPSAQVPAVESRRIILPEIVASVPVEGASQPYQNIHVHVELVLSGKGLPQAALNSTLESLGPRITAELLRTLTESKTLSARNLAPLRETLTHQARNVIEANLTEDPQLRTVKAELMVVSLYFTGPSIGRTHAE